MEFLRLVRRRSFLSEVIYIGLNVAFAIAVLIVMKTTASIWLAIALVLVSKWRVLAVRSRFWFANIQANLVDVIVGLSVVGYLNAVVTSTSLTSMQQWAFLIIVTLAYIVWLVLIKPRSSRRFVVAQAAVALFAGTSILFSISYDWPVSLVVIVMWLIGYATARHVLTTYDEETHLLPLSLVWGVTLAEIGWVAYHWTVGYRIPTTTTLFLPQIALIVLLVGFVAFKAYDSFYHHQKIRTTDVLLPILFTASVIFVLAIFFNGIGTSI
jgi:hypothetical protein